jgi:copper(I)-binding protein
MTKSTVAPAEKGGKTYVLGTLKNTGTQAITIKSATSDYAESVELHKTVNGVMSVDTAGWTLKPGESLELTDSGFHIAVKGLKASMKTGDAIEVHLNTTDGPAHLELTIGNATGSSHSH